MQPRNLIIDLGGVLYATDQDAAYAAFKALLPADRPPGGLPGNLPTDLRHLAEYPVFRDLETGASSPAQFRDGLREELGLHASDEAIDHAWNSLLVGVMPGRIRDLALLSPSYRMVLLSNTNRIHFDAFEQEVHELFACFEHCYLSFEMGMRKPSAEIYQEVLRHSGMRASESLFIDDSELNIAGASQVGLQVYHLGGKSPGGGSWESLLNILLQTV